MLVPLCNCNHHFSFLPPKTFPDPLIPILHCHYRTFLFKPLRRQIPISACIKSDTQTLPQSAIQRIAEKLRSLGYIEENEIQNDGQTSIPHPNSPGEIFVPLPTHLPKHRVGHTLDPSWSTPENPVPEPGSGNVIQRFHDLRHGVLKEREAEKIRKKVEKESVPSLAELTLPKEELKRLRSLGVELKQKLKIGKAGITEGIVNGIHERWRRSELVKIVVEDICRLNMRRTHDLLERKTGGFVVWRSGGNIILYRGPDYKYPYFTNGSTLSNDSSVEEFSVPHMDQRILGKSYVPSFVANDVESTLLSSKTSNSQPSLVQGVGLPDRVRFQLPGEAQLAEEADTLLEGLGPRFKDWWGYNPLPVDADLLPAVVPGYKRPFRLLPYGVKPKLTDDEMTTLRRLCRPLPCHFALGRNRKHQGLAAAIVKLWEKCEIAKIAVKRGVQNTNSLLMAEELKWLTGGTLLSRDREFIVFYRGKDFLPAAASSAIEERRKLVLDVEKSTYNMEKRKHKDEMEQNAPEVELNDENDPKISRYSEEKKLRLSELAMKRTDTKLSMALAKKAHAEKLLAELENEQTCQQPEIDKEGITEEERYMLRRIGLRMKAFLLLGRRGIFAGTVENMHLHWKYRELVKVCIGRRSIEEVHGVARTLEAESGGILVAVEPVSKGHAIIVYRGKNYKRPASLRPQTLLSKRAAMKRSIESQRRESLKLHVLKLNKNIDELKFRLAKDENPEEKLITEDVGQVSVKEQEMNQNHYKEDEEFHEDPLSDDESYAEDQANEEDREYPEMDVTSTSTDVRLLSSEVHMNIEQKVPYIFETLAQDIDPRPAVKESKGSPTIKKQNGNMEFPDRLWAQNGTSSSVSSYAHTNTRGMSADSDYQKAMAERPAVVMPVRASQLSNRERLLLRKQALMMKKQPVIAVGKSNIVSGVAKVIKAHFEKHPLAIVNIKGRAKGTSAQEVIYNLEQATGGVLVSQEPSKVILYRGWGSVKETNKSKKDSSSGEGMGEVRISRELLSAIRLESGLNAPNEERFDYEPIDDEVII